LRGQKIARREQWLKGKEAEFDARRKSFEQQMMKEQIAIQKQASKYFLKRRAIDAKELELMTKAEEMQRLGRDNDLAVKDSIPSCVAFGVPTTGGPRRPLKYATTIVYIDSPRLQGLVICSVLEDDLSAQNDVFT
jgi:hypothetical protein